MEYSNPAALKFSTSNVIEPSLSPLQLASVEPVMFAVNTLPATTVTAVSTVCSQTSGT